MTPKHRAVLDAIPPGSGLYLGSIKGRLAGKVPAADIPSIIDELVSVGLVTRSSWLRPVLYRRTEKEAP